METKQRLTASERLFYLLNLYNIFRLAAIIIASYALTLLIINAHTTSMGLGKYQIDINHRIIEEKEAFYINEDELKHLNFVVEDEGENIYSPIDSGYRYGPSMIYYDDGTMDAYFASNANNKEWDWISYRHFDGQNWSKEKIVLQPSGGSLDYNSTCDPGAVYFDGYYYLGYTSTINGKDGGIDNDIFVARSTSPDGPFEKWNGEGWGGDPYPIIDYDEDPNQWGAGEISFVIYNDQLYCYYSWYGESFFGTKLSIASLDENWPLTLSEGINVIARNSNLDSLDVAYLEEEKLFVGLCTFNRFSDNSGIVVYQSNDGISFKEVERFQNNIAKYCHNLGISKRSDGHILKYDDIYLGYGYGATWGKWSTRIHKLKYELIGGPLKNQKESPTLYEFTPNKESYVIGINVEPRVINLKVKQTKKISVVGYNNNLKKVSYKAKLNYLYNEDIIQIKNGQIIARQKGSCTVTIYNNDFYTTIKVNVD